MTRIVSEGNDTFLLLSEGSDVRIVSGVPKTRESERFPGFFLFGGIFCTRGIEQRSGGICQGDGENDADRAGDGTDELNGNVAGRHQLIPREIQRVEIEDQHHSAAENRKDQRIGHRTDHIASDVHAGAP